jgi:lysylphosphatidylglycerol synthetase-like protein (DUF2156 family)
VFEATIISGLGVSGRSDVLAALLLYRVIYTIAPFIAAVLGLSLMAGMARRRELTGGAQTIWRAFQPLVPPIAAGVVLLAGVLLLLSRSLPAEQSRLAVIAFNSLMTGKASRKQLEPAPDAVRRLVTTSEDSESNIALTGDKSFLVSDDESAFIAYADTGKSLIAKGDPTGDAKIAKKLVWQLRETADRQRKRCAFYAVSLKYIPVFLDLGLSILKIGEVARVDLSAFTLDGSNRKTLRQGRSRSARDGVPGSRWMRCLRNSCYGAQPKAITGSRWVLRPFRA